VVQAVGWPGQRLRNSRVPTGPVPARSLSSLAKGPGRQPGLEGSGGG